MGSTICWTCSNARANACPWMAFAKPVDGWQATPTLVRSRPRAGEQPCVYQSYEVKTCPLYHNDFGKETGKRDSCALCGKEYIQPYQWCKYCSPECKREANRLKNREWKQKKVKEETANQS